MFTGLVEDVGTVARADRRSDALVLAIRPAKLPLGELSVGESVCHDGACLTVTEVGRDSYSVLAGRETLDRTTLGQLRAGQHWVTGHIDGTGELVARRDLGSNLVLEVRTTHGRYIVEKGSIALAGVSLTVNAATGNAFSVAIIPHTRDATTLGVLAIGDRVNIEVDILAKHVEKLLAK